MIMITPRTINRRFYETLQKKLEEYGRGFNNFLCLETGYTSGFISQVVNGKQKASSEAQMAISKACGMDYASFLQESHKESSQEKEVYIDHLEKRLSNLEAQLPSFQSTTTTPQNNDIQNQKAKRNARHHEVIDQFQNHELATEINIKLVELEQYSVDELEEIQDIIDLKLRRLRKKQQTEQNQKTGTSGK